MHLDELLELIHTIFLLKYVIVHLFAGLVDLVLQIFELLVERIFNVFLSIVDRFSLSLVKVLDLGHDLRLDLSKLGINLPIDAYPLVDCLLGLLVLHLGVNDKSIE